MGVEHREFLFPKIEPLLRERALLFWFSIFFIKHGLLGSLKPEFFEPGPFGSNMKKYLTARLRRKYLF